MKNIFLLALFFLVNTRLQAAVIRITQADKTFLENATEKDAKDVFDNQALEDKLKVKVINAKVGDSLTFLNRDEVAHNASGLIGEEVLFDVKKQEPGANNDRTVVLNKKGEMTIQCLIHPKMTFKVKVE